MPKGILCCPVCGCTDLAIEAIARYIQNEEGDWVLDDTGLDQDTLRSALLNDYVEIRCENERCGRPFLDGKPLLVDENESVYEYWLRENQIAYTDFNQLTVEQQDAFRAFEAKLDYEQWEGTVGECVELDR